MSALHAYPHFEIVIIRLIAVLMLALLKRASLYRQLVCCYLQTGHHMRSYSPVFALCGVFLAFEYFPITLARKTPYGLKFEVLERVRISVFASPARGVTCSSPSHILTARHIHGFHDRAAVESSFDVSIPS